MAIWHIFLNRKSIGLVFLLLIIVESTYPRGYSALLSLNHTPSPVSQSLGNAGNAISTEDAFGLWHNPAHAGMAALENNLMVNLYPAEVHLKRNSFDGMSYSNFAALAGYDFGHDSSGLPLSIGFGVTKQKMNLGIPKIDSTYHLFTNNPYERIDGISAGACLDAGVKIAIGFTYKSIASDYFSWLMKDSSKAEYKTTAADIGILAVVPLAESFDLLGDLKFDASASIGLAFSNIGGKMAYQSKDDPLPRTANLGYSITIDIGYKGIINYYKLLRAEWTMEYEDFLVRTTNNKIEYEAIFSDLNVIQNIFLLKNPFRETIKYGAKFTLLNSILIMLGNYNSTGPRGEDHFTVGWGIKLHGLFDYLAGETQSDLFSFLGRHFDMAFYFNSKEEIGKEKYVRTYSAFTFSIKNFGF